jgi:hypothetical protein
MLISFYYLYCRYKMKVNKNSLSFNQTCFLNIFFLKINGLYAIDDNTINTIYNTILIILINCGQLILLSLVIKDAITFTINRAIDIEVYSGVIGLSGVYIRYIIYCTRRYDLKALLQEAENLWLELKDDEKLIIRYNSSLYEERTNPILSLTLLIQF